VFKKSLKPYVQLAMSGPDEHQTAAIIGADGFPVGPPVVGGTSAQLTIMPGEFERVSSLKTVVTMLGGRDIKRRENQGEREDP
jgi:hypothetical protein